MSKYMLAFHGGSMPDTPEEGQKMMAAWGAWMEGLGAGLADPGNPVGMSKTISASGVADNGGSNPLSGYSVVEADSMEAAIEMAKGCPILANEGTIEIAEIVVM